MKDKVRGKVEELQGKASDDKGLELKGKARQKLGGVKETAKSVAYDAEHAKKKR